jgi:hypothetical protein
MTVLNLAWALLLSGAGGGDPPPAPARFSLEDGAERDFQHRLSGHGLAVASDEEPKPQQEDEKPQRPQEPQEAKPLATQWSVVDFGWLELYPRAGLAIFSSKYHINPSPVLEIEAHAPIPWFSPASNPDGDYFGAFVHLNFAMIKRTIKPTLSKASGMMASLAVGLDYTFYRDDTWLLLARLGIQYTTYGGVTDLKDGGQAIAGVTVGLSVTRSLMFTLTPEIVYAKTGDHIMMGLLGVAVEF